jgi:hypothetical protein
VVASQVRMRWVTGLPLVAGSGLKVISIIGRCELCTCRLGVSMTVRGSTSSSFWKVLSSA